MGSTELIIFFNPLTDKLLYLNKTLLTYGSYDHRDSNLTLEDSSMALALNGGYNYYLM